MGDRKKQRSRMADADTELNEAIRQARELLARCYRDTGMLEAAKTRRSDGLVEMAPALRTHMDAPAPVINVREVPGGRL